MQNMQHPQRLDFVGRPCEVVDATHNGFIGLTGTILDESRNTLVVSSSQGMRRVPKVGCMFRIVFENDHNALISGRSIAYRPEERIKKAKVN